jgi:hypothetical protein
MTVHTIVLEKKEEASLGRCCAMMTIGSRKDSAKGRKRGSYNIHGKREAKRCPKEATKLIDGKPYCSMHGPTTFRIDPYYQSAPWRKLRKQVLERDNWTCTYCGNEANTADHVIPRRYGGVDDLTNLVAACQRCNKIASGNIFESLEQKKGWMRKTLSSVGGGTIGGRVGEISPR